MRKPIDLPFVKDGMSVRDLITAAGALQEILRAYDNFHDDPEEFVVRVAQYRGGYNPNA